MSKKGHVYFSSVYIGNSDNNTQNFNERSWMFNFIAYDLCYVFNNAVQYLDGDMISYEICHIPGAPKSNFNETVNHINSFSAAKKRQGIAVLALDFHVNNKSYARGLQVRYHRNSRNNAHAFFNNLKTFYGLAKLPVNDYIEGNPQGYVAKVAPEAFIIMLGSTGSNEDIDNIRSDNLPIRRHYMAYAIARAIFAHFGVKWQPKPGFEKHFEFRQFEPKPEIITAPVKKAEPKVEVPPPPPPEVYSQKKCLENKVMAEHHNYYLKTEIDIWKKYMFFEGLMDQYWTRAWRYRSVLENLISIFEQLLLLKKGGEKK